MNLSVFYGILIPFLGTSLGAACVFFMKHDMSERLSRILTGFAAGVMVAASIWSLLIPAMDQSEEITLEFCKNRSIFVRLVQSILRLLAPLL